MLKNFFNKKNISDLEQWWKISEIINIYSAITNEKINNKMREMNLEAKRKKYEGKKKLWIFFNKINTCLLIFFKWNFYKKNRALNRENLENNIRLIGAFKKKKRINRKIRLNQRGWWRWSISL